MRQWILGLIALCASASVQAGMLTIEITGGVEGALPIAVVPFGFEGEGEPPVDIGAIVRANLERSGRFAPLANERLVARPHEGRDINFAEWRPLATENLVVGKVRTTGPGRYVVQFQLFDVFQGRQLAGYSIAATNRSLRRAAHQVSDIIYEQLTGERGAFDTLVAYIRVTRDAEGRATHVLAVSDADGHDEQIVLNSREPLMSPAWAPDGRRLAYVSFENGRSEIFVQNIITGQREKVASWPGINSAPAWAPDGRRLAMTLSHEGSPSIYVFDLESRRLHRITHGTAIDTEASWAPDGQSLIFTSDRSGPPQIYQVGINPDGSARGSVQRLTFEGRYNARASWSPNGRSIVMVHGADGGFRIALLDVASGRLRLLTRTLNDESPRFSPNGSMVIYATRHRQQGVLEVVSVDGRAHQRLVLRDGEVREPAWSPFKPE